MTRYAQSRSWISMLLSPIPVVIVAVIVFAIWSTVVWWFQLPRILLPPPTQVWETAVAEREALGRAMLSTGIAATIGLTAAVLLGFLVAILFSQSNWIRRSLYPYVIFLQTVPIVAIAPLLITWSGYQFRTVVIVTVIISIFPIINNVTAGLTNIQRELADLFRLYGAGRIQRLWRLQIPLAMPYLVLGARISSGLAVIGTIVAEFFVGNGSSYDGLGTLMTGWQAMQRTDALIAGVLASTLLGLLLLGLVELVSITLLRRWTK